MLPTSRSSQFRQCLLRAGIAGEGGALLCNTCQTYFTDVSETQQAYSHQVIEIMIDVLISAG